MHRLGIGVVITAPIHALYDTARTVSIGSNLPNIDIHSQGEDGIAFLIGFDLNQPGHANDERNIRSHLHPGSDVLLVPAPFMSPVEVLGILLHDLRSPRKPRSRGSEP